MQKTMESLNWLLDYELRSSARYRRFLSVVSVSYDNGQAGFKDVLSGAIRGSDEVVQFDHGASILMGDTDQAGALTAIERYRDRCDGIMDLRFGVAAYPGDGSDATTLLAIAENRVNEAKAGDAGAVVWQ